MTSDYVADSAIDQLQSRAAAAIEQIEALRQKVDKLTEAAAQRNFSASSESSSVKATVNGNGELLSLEIAPVDRRRPDTERLSADLTAAIQAARDVAAQAVGERMWRIFGEA